ncbi:MAG: putative glycoside hydrolase [Pseudomonadota bacterium]
MCITHRRLALLLLLTLVSLGVSSSASAGLVKGIYLTQTTMEDTKYLKYLIEHSKAVGINTFVVDMEIPSKLYQRNVALLKENNIQYVARVVVFPQGGHPDQIVSPAYWAKRYRLIDTAMNYGANQIQLDYIRYNVHTRASSENAKNILKVVQYYKQKVSERGIPLQADVFGISSFGESKHIGQNLRLMAQSLDAICPMVYPSHFEPYREHAVTPYDTVYKSLRALRSQFNYQMPVKLYAYIEISNYRYPLPGAKRRSYIIAEMKAVRDAGADGWYVWSAHNYYDYLFSLMGDLAKNDASVLEPGKSADVKTLEANAAKNPTTPDTEVAPKPTEAANVPTAKPTEAVETPATSVLTNTVEAKPATPAPSLASSENEDTDHDVSLAIHDPSKLTWTLRSHHSTN